MGRQSARATSKANPGKAPEIFGKGSVTPIQVAYIVDQYLLENAFSAARAAFRTEAASLLAKSDPNEAPNGLLTLGAILNEYISLKGQKVALDHEKIRLDQEKSRVQNLMHGMQSAMTAYIAAGNSPALLLPPVAPKAAVTLPQPVKVPSPGIPSMITPIDPVSTPPNSANFTSPMTNNVPLLNKRKDSNTISVAPPLAKRSRGKVSTRTISQKGKGSCSQEIAQPSSCIVTSSPNGLLQNVSSVAKCLFNPTNTSVPMTPPRANSSQSEKSVSPPTICSTDNTPEGFTTRCTVISSKRVMVSPCKQFTYAMERNERISTSSPVKPNLKRDHVKGRLDFDDSTVVMNFNEEQILTPESEDIDDIFGMDLPSLEAIGADFSFSDMLRDFELECEMGYSCQPGVGASMDNASGSSPDSMDGNVVANQLVSEFSSTVTESLSDKDPSLQGMDSMRSVQSVTRCIKIISPVKNQGNPVNQNYHPTN